MSLHRIFVPRLRGAGPTNRLRKVTTLGLGLLRRPGSTLDRTSVQSGLAVLTADVGDGVSVG